MNIDKETGCGSDENKEKIRQKLLQLGETPRAIARELHSLGACPVAKYLAKSFGKTKISLQGETIVIHVQGKLYRFNTMSHEELAAVHAFINGVQP
jgi:hypothetical protein